MSFYSDEIIKTEILEAVVHIPNNRSEFRLRGMDLNTNLKLINVQPVETTNTATSNDQCGSLGVIRNLYLYDGQQELASIRDFHRYVGFKNLLNSNEYNGQVSRALDYHNLGYTSQQKGGVLANQQRQTLVKNQQVDALPAVPDAAASISLNNAYLNLRQVFAFLARIPVLSQKMFKDLRLVVEYNTDSRLFTDRNDKSGSLSESRPLLVVDRIMDQSVLNRMLSLTKSFEFNAVEHDRFQVAATAAGSRQSVEQTLKGFSGKRVERLRIQKNFVSTDSYFTGNAINDRFGIHGSNCGHEEQYQITVNGRPLAPDADGFRGDNRALALLSDSYGSLNLFETSLYHVKADYETSNSLSLSVNVNGNQNYFGLYIGEKVNELKFQYSRIGKAGGSNDGTNTQYNSQLQIFIEAEVVKAFVLNNGQYQIVYV